METSNPFEQPADPQPPPLAPSEPELADHADRFLGALVDRLVIFGPVFLIVFVQVSLGVQESQEAKDRTTAFFALWWLGLTLYQWYWTATDGTTIGKRLMGTRIVHEDGREVGFLFGVVLRNWVLGLPTLLLGALACPLGLLDVLLVAGERRKCLHDWIATTVVVVDRRNRPRRPRLPGTQPAA